MENCLVYVRWSYNEVYIGLAVVVIIVAGVPTCILSVEFMLNFKFCTKYDEEKDAQLGGMTICETITYCFTCGESHQIPERTIDDYEYKYEEPSEE